jgi:hypothetical protein
MGKYEYMSIYIAFTYLQEEPVFIPPEEYVAQSIHIGLMIYVLHSVLTAQMLREVKESR